MALRRVELGVAERLLYPVVPAVITAEHRGRLGAMVAAWWMQVSFTPFMVAVAIAPERYTYKLVRGSGVFGLNLLGAEHLEKLSLLGDVSARFMRDKVERSGLRVVRGEALGAPLIAEAAAALEARVWRVYEAGDHDIFVGEVAAAYASEDFADGMWRLERYRPIMYLGRTRRPGPVRRVYVVPEAFRRVEVDYAPGDLRRYAEARRRLLDDLYRAAEEARDEAELRRRVEEIVSRHGLEPDDVEPLLEEARRRARARG